MLVKLTTNDYLEKKKEDLKMHLKVRLDEKNTLQAKKYKIVSRTDVYKHMSTTVEIATLVSWKMHQENFLIVEQNISLPGNCKLHSFLQVKFKV